MIFHSKFLAFLFLENLFSRISTITHDYCILLLLSKPIHLQLAELSKEIYSNQSNYIAINFSELKYMKYFIHSYMSIIKSSHMRTL